MVKKFNFPEFGYEVEIGKFARQADGAAWLTQGGTVVLATAVSAPSKEFPGFLPLTVDYREQFSAAGKIPGGYFKREGKSTDREVLIGRYIDRSIRPLFPMQYFDQLQVIATVYSVNKEYAPNILGIIASSIALAVSKIPFLGPIGAVEMVRLDGKWVCNPKFSDSLKADAKLVIAGTHEGICMVEGSGAELDESEFVDVLFSAHEKIKQLVKWQKEIQKEVAAQKQEIDDVYNWKEWETRINSFLTDAVVQTVNVPDKIQRNERLDKIRDAFNELYKEQIGDNDETRRVIDYILDKLLQLKYTELIFSQGKRIDGRAYDQVRPISVEVGLLPFTHGSALFTRGRTQALVTATLGGGEDEQKIESIMDHDGEGTFMLHYNFPPFSVGEVRPMRGPGRREVGHGHLAASAIRRMLPSNHDFPYTIRIVADMLESDGSTSMATVCGSTMSLMNAGVPIKKMVSGVAMGLLRSITSGKFTILTDISGFEDEFGLMDFKVAGTENGITAIQMDIKYKGGFERDVFESALAQAKKGRLHILGEMRKVMSAPAPELSPLVPKLVTVKVNPEKIGAIIGTGGKVIKEIIAKTNTSIDIDETGLVKIFGAPGANIEMAVNWVKTLGGQIEPGAIYHGKIRRLADFGIFVELVPGLDGLVHVSNIPRDKQRTFLRDYKVDDMVTVEVLEYDESTGRVRLRLIEK